MTSGRPPSRDDFEIAIICALPLERDAVEALLDEDYEEDGQSYTKAVGDKNAYTIGRLGKQHVVVAHMPGMGTISAAAVAANLMSSFVNIKIAFVVGICGGVPTSGGADRDEVRLGDVIVSTAVVQIDFGRQYPNGFKRKNEVEDSLGRANPEIRAFVGKLSGYRSQKRLKDKAYLFSTQLSSMEGFSSSTYPGPQHDIIYAADHRHKHWNQSCKICDKCEGHDDDVCKPALDSYCSNLGCSGMTLVQRTPSAASLGYAPDGIQSVTAELWEKARRANIHFGRIACGNQVIKSGVHRNSLAAKEKVIGFEMESAGTWDYVPTIVVKSVCDYADSHKSKRWQGYAAATAAACTKAILEEWRNVDRRDQSSPLPPQLGFPVHRTVTQSANTLFTGRHDVLQDLKSIIQEAVADRSAHVPCHIVISGIGGQGKSEICLQLTYQLGNLFWGIFWIDVSTRTLAENGFLDIASRLGVTVSTWQKAKLELLNAQQPWLLVLDNADDPDFDYQPYFPATTFGVVIMTSRNADCRRYATKRWVDLEGLSHFDARELLFRAANIPIARQGSLESDAQVVVQLLQSHPLALVQAGSYVERGHCSLKDYPGIYERQRKRLMVFRPAQARSRYQDVYATFEASTETLRVSDTEVADDALQLLSILAMYGPKRLPLILFEDAWKKAQPYTTEVEDSDLLSMIPWHRARLPLFLQIDAEAWDAFRLVQALTLLKSFSLLSLDSAESSLNISMHPLVHAWARDRLSPEQQHMCWVQAGSIMAFTYYQSDAWRHYARQLEPHLQAVLSWTTTTMFGSARTVNICRVLVRCGWLLVSRQDRATLSTLTDQLCDWLQLERSTVTLQWIEIYHLTAWSLHSSGRTKDAVPLLEQVVKIKELTMSEDNHFLLSSQYQLARMYRSNGQLDEARRLQEQVLRIREQTLGEDHRSRLSSQHDLAKVYRASGQIKEAVALFEHVVEARERTLAEDDEFRVTSQYQLAMAYQENNQITEAITLLEQVIKMRQRTLAEEHTNLLYPQYELAKNYRLKEQFHDAVTLLEHVVKIKERTGRKDDSFLINSQCQLAICLWNANERIRARDVMRHAIDVWRPLGRNPADFAVCEAWLKYFEDELHTEAELSATS